MPKKTKKSIKRFDKREQRKNKSSYSPGKLTKAVSLIKNGSLTAHQASKTFNIPRTTLTYKSNGLRPEGYVKPGPKPMLGYSNEQILVDWVQQCCNKGFPLTKDSLLYSAKMLFQEGHGKLVHTFDIEKGPGRRWYEGFMSRHQNLTLRTAEFLHKGRAAVTESTIRKWFENIMMELKDHLDIFKDPRRIFNTDETCFFLHPKSRPVLATKGQKTVYDASGTCNKENMTILITGNAAGNIAPPLALVSYKKIPSDIAATANPAWSIGRTENGWMTSQSFFEYIANVFEPYLKDIPKPVILFLDGHSSHLSLQLSRFCLEKQIILVSLPPNATHIMQPLDVSFFGPLKKCWSKKLDQFKIEKKIEPKKCHILPILESILAQPNFKEDLESGFLACGLYPLNPDTIDYTKCLCNGSKITQNDQIDNDEDRDALLNLFEQRLPISLKKKFDELDVKTKWPGKKELEGLFNFYKAVKFKLNYEDLCPSDPTENGDNLHIMVGIEELTENGTDVEFPFPNSDLDNMDFGNELNLDISVTYGDLIKPPTSLPIGDGENSNLPDPHETLPDFTACVNHLNSNLPDPHETLPDFTACINHLNSNLPDPHETLPDFAAHVNFDNTNDALDLTNHLNSNLPDPHETLPDFAAHVNFDNTNDALDLTISVHCANLNKTPVGTSVTPPSAGSSISSGRSVKEILDSIIKYNGKESSPDQSSEKSKTVRKRLQLPSVMTSQDWIALKTASEEEKNAKEKQKEDRKKDKEMKKKAAQEKKNEPRKRKECRKGKKKIHVEKIQKPEKSKLIKPLFVENSISNVVENPKEVNIGDWVVVEFELPNSSPRRFIAKIYKSFKGRLFGDFLRPTSSRQNKGFVYKYPDVRDKAKVNFNQIKKILPSPEVHGRA